MAQVNIKPNRIKFIKALEDSVKRIKDERKQYEIDIKQYQKDLEEWEKTADLSPENIKSSKINVNYSDDKPYEVKVVLKKYPPNKPKKPSTPTLDGWYEREALEDLNGVIAMLKLTDEDVVNASVANKVAKYL